MDKTFENIIRECIIEKLKVRKILKKSWINLDGIMIDFSIIPHEKLLSNYIELKRKYFYSEKAMEVEYLDAYKRKIFLITKKQKIIIKEIEDRFKDGKSIKPYLTSNLHFTKFSKEDFLLKNYNIYHLHLNSANKNEHLVKRANKLIFFTYDKEKVYFIDIIKHPIGDEWDKVKDNLLKQLETSKKESLNIKNVDKNYKVLFGDENKIKKELKKIEDTLNETLKIKDDCVNNLKQIKQKILEVL